MKLYVITGGSKGLGLEVCQQALIAGHMVINLSRSKGPLKSGSLEQYTLDLSKPIATEKRIKSILLKIDKSARYSKIQEIVLINNAGILDPLGPVDRVDPKESTQHLNVNLIGPILTTKYFTQLALLKKMKLAVINIGSGAGKHPIAGWAHYCASKAALQLFTETCALDYAKNKYLRFIHLSPGIIDTGMQKQIRSTSESLFPDVKKFKQYKKNNSLQKPEKVAKTLLTFIEQSSKTAQTSWTISEMEARHEKK